MFRKPLFIEATILSLSVLILHIIASANHLYWSIYEFDCLLHFLGGAALSLIFVWLYFFSGFFNPSRRSLSRFLLVALVGAMLVSVLWEIYELIFKRTMVEKADYPFDLMMDLTMDAFGAVAACFYAHIKELKNGQS